MPTPAEPLTADRDATSPAGRRTQSAQSRLVAADARDELARARDLVALARDRAADARNVALADREAADQQRGEARAVTGAEVIIRAAGERKRVLRLRLEAAEQRALASEDLHDAALDRERSAHERLYALVDRELLASQLAVAETDPLTGARTRAAGLIDLDREIDRCRRDSGLLVVAYVDVVGLKHRNDTEGHSAGDDLLRGIVALVKQHLRSYDLVIRLGGDEFLFAMSNMSMRDVRQRFSAIAAALAGAPDARSISVGYAQLTADDSASALIARADDELVESRRANHDSRPGPAAAPR